MPKLHEGLAIHKDRVGVVRKVFEEAGKVFKTAAHFRGFVKDTSYIDEKDKRFDKHEEKKIDETVPGKLKYINESFSKLLDLDYQMEVANTEAKADLILDGSVIASGVPVNFLLTIENKFREYRDVLDAIPTHQAGVEWIIDTDMSSNGDIYRAKQVPVDYITKKVAVHKVIVPATEHHPAQVAESHDDVRVAEVRTVHYGGTISPAEKSDILGRCDQVIMAAKKARQRANAVALPKKRVAADILTFVVDGNLDVLTTPAAEPDDI